MLCGSVWSIDQRRNVQTFEPTSRHSNQHPDILFLDSFFTFLSWFLLLLSAPIMFQVLAREKNHFSPAPRPFCTDPLSFLSVYRTGLCSFVSLLSVDFRVVCFKIIFLTIISLNHSFGSIFSDLIINSLVYFFDQNCLKTDTCFSTITSSGFFFVYPFIH